MSQNFNFQSTPRCFALLDMTTYSTTLVLFHSSHYISGLYTYLEYTYQIYIHTRDIYNIYILQIYIILDNNMYIYILQGVFDIVI